MNSYVTTWASEWLGGRVGEWVSELVGGLLKDISEWLGECLS